MRSVKAIYENGAVTLFEPASLKDKQQVTVLIPDQGKRSASEVLRFGGMFSDLEPDELAAFDQAVQQGITFKRMIRP